MNDAANESPEKQADAAAAEARKRRIKTRLLSLQDIDRRTVAYREAMRLIEAMEHDLGGTDSLSAGERQLIQRAGVLGAMLADIEARWLRGEEIDPADYCIITNSQRRVIESVGIKRVPRNVTPSISTYIEAAQ